MIRRYGEPKLEGVSYTLRPGAYAILPRNGSLLLTHQTAPTSEFQLPGGGVDKGESTMAALHREVIEETGWRIAQPTFLHAFRRFVFMPDYDIWAEKICKIYVARPIRRLGPPTEVGHTAKWIRVEDATDCLRNPGDRAAINQYFGLNTREG
ncbi:MAG: 8-oxo-dGTP diphosphatase [Celeribacter sp.]|jgi:8-oxo-dGTP diphosphatase